jgi:predicted dehydrogenase
MLKVGIIGLGGIAKSHFEAIASLDDVEVVAVADLFEEPRTRHMKTYGVDKGYPSHTELLQDPEVDAVAVTLGHQLHHRLTVDACRAGKHVMVEKPMALTLEQCDNMIDAAEAAGVKLMVGLTQHFAGPALAAKQILDAGELGPLITSISYMSKSWGYANRRPQYRSRFHGGGMWMTNGVHVVDRLNWVMASQAVSVSAAIGTRAHYQAADDSATAFIRYKNGLAGVAIAVGYADGGKIYDCVVIGATGSMRFATGKDGGVLQIGKGEEWRDVPFEEPPGNMTEQWRSFARAIELNIEPPTHGELGRHVVEVLLAAEESSISGREVMLESGRQWTSQTSGSPVNTEHGWI